MTPAPSLDDCIQSLALHLRCLQRAGLRCDVPARRPAATAAAPSRTARLDELCEDSAGCRRCRLCSERSQVVFGDGNPEARLLFVGDAPDRISDTQGRPFAGESGRLLERIIEAISLRRSQVYLTYAVKCLAAQPDDPGDDALEACRPILQRQIAIIQPLIICALGPAAARVLQEPGTPGTPARGKFYRMGPVLVMPTHHPDILLRRPELKREAWIDVQRIQRELASPPFHKS